MKNPKNILYIYKAKGIEAALKLVNGSSKSSAIFRNETSIAVGPNIVVRKKSGLSNYVIEISSANVAGEVPEMGVQCVDVYGTVTDVETDISTGGILTDGDVIYVTDTAAFYIIVGNHIVISSNVQTNVANIGNNTTAGEYVLLGRSKDFKELYSSEIMADIGSHNFAVVP